jgi:hypothetical protein
MKPQPTAEHRLALSRILLVTAVREPGWLALLQRVIKRRLQHTGHCPSQDKCTPQRD